MEKSRLGNLNEIISKFGENIPEEISLALKQILEEKLDGINFSEDMDTKDSMETIVNGYMRKAAPTIKQLSQQIAEILNKKISKEYKSL